MVNKAFGLPCCCGCEACSGSAPDPINVTLAALDNEECDDCTDLNTLFGLDYQDLEAPPAWILTPARDSEICKWSYTGAYPCDNSCGCDCSPDMEAGCIADMDCVLIGESNIYCNCGFCDEDMTTCHDSLGRNVEELTGFCGGGFCDYNDPWNTIDSCTAPSGITINLWIYARPSDDVIVAFIEIFIGGDLVAMGEHVFTGQTNSIDCSSLSQSINLTGEGYGYCDWSTPATAALAAA